MRANIYQGPDSCYAQREGIYIAGSGVSAENAREFLKFIERDLKRGWTYNHSCEKIPMTPKLAAKRALYLIALAKKHSGIRAAWAVREAVYDWLSKTGLAKYAKRVALAVRR